MLSLIDKAAGKWLDWRMDREIRKSGYDEGFGLKKVEVKDGEFQGTFVTPAVAIMAQEGAEMLEAANADNYVQFDMMPRLDRGLKPIRVTIQWAHGLAPAQKASKMESALRQAVSCLEAWKQSPDHEWNEADEGELVELKAALGQYGGG